MRGDKYGFRSLRVEGFGVRDAGFKVLNGNKKNGRP